jgi:hypothetical protein
MANLSDKIVTLLEPGIGKSMAGTVVRTNCTKIGTSPEELNFKNIDEFIKNLTPALNVFAGEDFARKVVEKIKEMKG